MYIYIYVYAYVVIYMRGMCKCFQYTLEFFKVTRKREFFD